MSHTIDESVTKNASEVEQTFTLWTVFKRSAERNRAGGADDFRELSEELLGRGVTVRGLYDVSAMRDDADVMVWLHGPEAEALQSAVRDIRRSELMAGTSIAWSAMGAHREAEFAKSHSPSYFRGLEPSRWLCVYPFVRSYEWYMLPPEERGTMLRDHGILGRDYPQVQANTVSAFALGDWEWLLGLEAPKLVDLMDMMRHLRNTPARLHVREEIPFYTGRRVDADEVAEVLR